MFGMFLVFPKLALRCALDPLAGLMDPPEAKPDEKAGPALDEPKDGE